MSETAWWGCCVVVWTIWSSKEGEVRVGGKAPSVGWVWKQPASPQILRWTVSGMLWAGVSQMGNVVLGVIWLGGPVLGFHHFFPSVQWNSGIMFVKQTHKRMAVCTWAYLVKSQRGKSLPRGLEYLSAGRHIFSPVAKSMSCSKRWLCIIYYCMPSTRGNVCHIEGVWEMYSEWMSKGIVYQKASGCAWIWMRVRRF